MANAAANKLFTLTEVAKRTKISMPTLQRYKKLYQTRIPSTGEGRKQRYPEEALAVFLQLKKENIGKRGRPRKTAAAGAAPAAASKPTKSTRGRKSAAAPAKKAATKLKDDLLTLTQVSKLTKISYPTLLRYVKSNLADIPHEGTGRGRRYHKEAVAVFKQLRSQSKRGRKRKIPTTSATTTAKKATTTASPRRRGRPPKEIDLGELQNRISQLEKVCKTLERTVIRQQKKLDKPFRILVGRK